jgi:3'-phosphoadenosine 5'-phosphosulfate sulfotransferase (PAPS reductase)/FAD synthetase
MSPDYIIFASYGNDSIALIQFAHERGLKNVTTVFSDTGWAATWWKDRVLEAEDWVRSLGFTPSRTTSMGLEALVRKKKGWPRQGMQFCTLHLKIEPAMRWLDENDPEKQATCLVGVRREESQARRTFPEFLDESPNHGGRKLWAPLVNFTTEDRDGLLKRAGFEPLPHRSMECFPCINSNRADLRILSQDAIRIQEIASLEQDLGYTAKGKPRTMFRPYRHMGATGIEQIVQWATSERGQFDLDDGTGAECESGYCGT